MHTQDDPESEGVDSPGTLRTFFFGLFGLFRAIAIVASLVFAGVGAVLAFNLFFFLQAIISEPAGVFAEWKSMFEAPPPVSPPLESDAAPTSDPASTATEAHPAVDLPDAPSPAAETAAPERSAESAPAESAEPVPAAAAPAHEPSAAGTAPRPDPVATAPGNEEEPDRNPWFALGEQLLEAVESGEMGSLAGFAILVLLCWILCKIPLVMITTGGKVLVDLFKIGRE